MTAPVFEPGAKLQRWERNLANPEAALRAIGAIGVSGAQRAFRDQGFAGKPWRERAAPNVFGILADFAQGKKSPPKRRFERRPALRDTGALARSIVFRITGPDTVEWGSPMPYAAVHQKGGTAESVRITETLQEALGDWLKRRPKDLQKRLGWLLSPKLVGKTLKQRVPARPFLGISDEMHDEMRQAVRVLLEVR